jgi:hypothetical protein
MSRYVFIILGLEKEQTDCSIVQEILEHLQEAIEHKVEDKTLYAEQWRSLLQESIIPKSCRPDSTLMAFSLSRVPVAQRQLRNFHICKIWARISDSQLVAEDKEELWVLTRPETAG